MMEQVETAMCTEAIVPGMGWMAQRGHGFLGEFETATKATVPFFLIGLSYISPIFQRDHLLASRQRIVRTYRL